MSLSYDLIRARIITLVKNFPSWAGGSLPKDVNSGNCHEKLNRRQITDGVCLFTYYLDMAGSAGDIDLYKLNQAYILDTSMREIINEQLKGWWCP